MEHPCTPASTEASLIAIFGSAFEAQAAASELVTNAFAGDHIHIVSEALPAENRPAPRAGHREPDVKRWLLSILGRATASDRQRFEQVVREGKSVVGVSTPYQMLEKAAEIIDHHAPVETVVAKTAPAYRI